MAINSQDIINTSDQFTIVLFKLNIILHKDINFHTRTSFIEKLFVYWKNKGMYKYG